VRRRSRGRAAPVWPSVRTTTHGTRRRKLLINVDLRVVTREYYHPTNTSPCPCPCPNVRTWDGERGAERERDAESCIEHDVRIYVFLRNYLYNYTFFNPLERNLTLSENSISLETEWLSFRSFREWDFTLRNEIHSENFREHI